VAGGVRHSRAGLVFLLERSTGFEGHFDESRIEKLGRALGYDSKQFLTPHQLAFDIEKRACTGQDNEPI
jgi:hypothetical protein